MRARTRTRTRTRTGGYCVKCQQMIEMADPEVVEMKNGRLAHQGYCPFCGTAVYKFLPKDFEG